MRRRTQSCFKSPYRVIRSTGMWKRGFQHEKQSISSRTLKMYFRRTRTNTSLTFDDDGPTLSDNECRWFYFVGHARVNLKNHFRTQKRNAKHPSGLADVLGNFLFFFENVSFFRNTRNRRPSVGLTLDGRPELVGLGVALGPGVRVVVAGPRQVVQRRRRHRHDFLHQCRAPALQLPVLFVPLRTRTVIPSGPYDRWNKRIAIHAFEETMKTKCAHYARCKLLFIVVRKKYALFLLSKTLLDIEFVAPFFVVDFTVGWETLKSEEFIEKTLL